MWLVKNRVKVVLGIILFYVPSFGSIDNESNVETEAFKYVLNDSTEKKCGQFMKLEGKPVLTEKEERVGELLHKLLLSITSSPVDYCGDIQMASVDEIRPK